MEFWFDTVETIPEGVGFAHFDGLHLSWLAAFVLFTAAVSILYRRQKSEIRARMRKAMALVIVGDELFKMTMLTIGGRYLPTYLPLHLCSVNIILIAIHAWKPGETLDNFLYAVGIPGALAALLFPTWVELPLGNFMHIHSFTVHILLAAYPIMVLSGGDLRPDWKQIPRCLALLTILAVVAGFVNDLFDTNFMFLESAGKGNPLYLFKQAFGDHRVGFAVLIPAVLVVMYGPLELWKRLRKS